MQCVVHIDDLMKLKVLGRFFVDLLEKGQLLLMPLLTLDAADQFPWGRSEKAPSSKIEASKYKRSSPVSLQKMGFFRGSLEVSQCSE